MLTGIRRQNSRTSSMTSPHVLVIRLSSLGDVVLTLPVLMALKAEWPGAHLTFLTKRAFSPVLFNVSSADEIAVFEDKGLWGWAREIRRRRFDVVIDLHDTFRSRLWSFLSGAAQTVRYDKRAADRRRLVWTKRVSTRLAGGVVDRYLETLTSLGVPSAGRIPKLFLSPEERLPERLENRLGAGPFVAIAPGAIHPTKRWLPERFAEAADRLAEGRPVILLGAAADIPAAQQVMQTLTSPAQSFVGQTSVREMMLILRRCALLLTNDSGAMHVAAALGVPVVALFGPTVKPFGFFPAGPSTAVVEAEGLDCRPCSVHGSEKCPLNHFRCMKEISVDRVVASAQALLESPPKSSS
jgi:heptosyltransferase-2